MRWTRRAPSCQPSESQDPARPDPPPSRSTVTVTCQWPARGGRGAPLGFRVVGRHRRLPASQRLPLPGLSAPDSESLTRLGRTRRRVDCPGALRVRQWLGPQSHLLDEGSGCRAVRPGRSCPGVQPKQACALLRAPRRCRRATAALAGEVDSDTPLPQRRLAEAASRRRYESRSAPGTPPGVRSVVSQLLLSLLSPLPSGSSWKFLLPLPPARPARLVPGPAA
jgi:hypothetical protein